MARQEPSRFPFTTARLNALPKPTGGRRYYYDQRRAGLCVCVTRTGARTFYLYKKVDGRPERVRLGRFPDVSIDAARKAVAEMVGEIAGGCNPAAERRARREAPTLADLFGHWLETHAKRHKKTWQEDDRQYSVFLKPWGGRRLETIKKTHVQALHARVGERNGIYAANRLLALLRAMFNKAADIGWTGANPTKGVKRFREKSRDRFLQANELPRFFQALSEEDPIFRDYFLLALLTGARRADLQAMRWEDVNLQVGIWRIPDTKSGEPVLVPIAPAAARILQSRREAHGGGPWVFPTRSKTGHLVEPKGSWKRILKGAGLEDLRIHDLRRTLGSWQAALGASLPVIGKALGHKQVSTTAIYARLQLGPVRKSVDQATAAMLTAGGLIEGPKGGDDAFLQE